MNRQRILVIGATGNVGGALAGRLAAGPAEIRALVRDPVTARLPAGVRAVRGDLTAPDTLHAAADGVDAVFLVWPLGSGEFAAPVAEALAGRARRIVYLSSAGVRDDADDPINRFHAEVERAIRGSGAEFTFLRSGGFAANTLGWASQIRSGDAVSWPYGAAARPLIHEQDLAEIAELALMSDEHVGTVHTLTGPAALTQADQVRAIGAALGRTLRWVELPAGEALAQMMSWGWPRATAEGALRAWADMVTHPEPVSPTFADLTGRPGRTFRQWAEDHAADFRSTSSS